MKFSTYILGFSYLVLLFTNCVEEFNPPAQDFENLLIVEAFLSDSNEPFEVRLSRSIPIDTSALIPETGAAIRLSEESGESYNLLEAGNSGIYSYPGIINTQIGKSYQIHIQTRNGSQYESSKVTMRKTPEIDSVTFAYEERPTAFLKGVQIYVNTHDPENDTYYYRWEWDDTWEFYTAYRSGHIYENGQIFLRQDDIYRCWKSSRSTTIDLATSKNLSQDIISKYPLVYVSTESDRLGSRYSINVKQYALSEASYNYWVELQKVTESLGTLFDPQPSTVYGNIQNVNDQSEVVLGYFDVSTVTEKRIFITRVDMPPIRVPDYYNYCVDSVVTFNFVEPMIEAGYMLAYETQDDFGRFIYVMSSPPCIDCRIYGTNTKPDFW